MQLSIFSTSITHCCRSSLEACREKSLDQVMKSVIVDDITFDHGPWLHMSAEGLDLLQVRSRCRVSLIDS
jgi:hypothetical protein